MPRYTTSRVREITEERAGLQRVLLDDGSRAYVLTEVVGPVSAGDEVVLNTTAVDLGLGPGGWHVVHWNLARRDLWIPGGGHIMKLRYTSLQADTGSAEEHLDDLPTDLDGLPVVVCSVHSQVPCVAVALKRTKPKVIRLCAKEWLWIAGGIEPRWETAILI